MIDLTNGGAEVARPPGASADAKGANAAPPADASRRRFIAMARAALARGGVVQFRASGRSMEPTIRDGAVVAIAAVAAASVRIGDVVLCTVNLGAVVVHRVVGARGASVLVVRGDAPAAEPDRIRRDAVLGRAVGVVVADPAGGERIVPLAAGARARLAVTARRAVHRLRASLSGRGARAKR